MNTPGGKCPGCGVDIDWHTEWVAEQGLVYQGKAALDYPQCGAAVLMPRYANFSLAPDTVPVLKRSLSRARTWASKQVTPMELDDYLRSTEGSPYQHYRFDP